MVTQDIDTSTRPSLLSLALPSILTNLSYSVIVLVQTKFVGDISAEAIAAIGIGQRVFFATQALLMAVSAGTTALVARAWGSNDPAEATKITMASIALAGVLGIATAIPAILFAPQIAGIFGMNDSIVVMASQNIRWMAVFNLSFAIGFVLSAAVRAAGDAWTPLWTALAMNIVNIPLLYVMVPGNLGFPQLGVAGAAIAGGIAGTVGTIILGALWLAQRLRVRFEMRNWYSRDRIRRLVDIGYPAGVEMLVFQVGYFVFLIILGQKYGESAMAAYGVGGSLFMICMVIGFGFSIAGSTLSGQHLGARDPDGASRAGWRALLFAALTMGSSAAVIAYFAADLVRVFIHDDLLAITYAIEISWLIAITAPLMAVEFAIGGALRGAGDTRFPLIATFVGLIGVRLLVAVTCVLADLPVIWLFASTVFEYAVKSGMLLWRFHRGKWKSLPQFLAVDDEPRNAVEDSSTRKSLSGTA